MQETSVDHLTLIDELDSQQNALLDQLDELNLRIEAVLAEITAASTEETPPLAKAA